MEPAGNGACNGKVTLLIKNPSKLDRNFQLEVSATATIADVQKKLSESYEGNPSPSEQTLIYAGKVLKDPSIKIQELIKNETVPGPHSFHLVVKHRAGSSASTSSPSSSMNATPSATPVVPPSQPAAAASASVHASSSSSDGAAPSSEPEASTSSLPGDSYPFFPGSIPHMAPYMQQELPPMYSYVYVNPVMAAAYQAAYTAALAASNVLQHNAQAAQGTQGAAGQTSAYMLSFAPTLPMALYYPAYSQGFLAGAAQASSAGQPPMVPNMPFGYLGMPQAPLGQGFTMQPHAGASLPANLSIAGLRQRHGAAATSAPAAAAPAAGAPANQHRPRRQRVFTLRINTRTLLQFLVFAMVLYQHFTWNRFIALIVGALVLYLTASWAPLRRIMAGMHGGQQGGAQGRSNTPQPRGIIQEIAVVLLGFVTSLLPAWNYNPEDAAAFAAAQAMMADNERDRPGNENNNGPQPEGGPEHAGGPPDIAA